MVPPRHGARHPITHVRSSAHLCACLHMHLLTVPEIELFLYQTHGLSPHETVFVRPQMVLAVFNLNEEWGGGGSVPDPNRRRVGR